MTCGPPVLPMLAKPTGDTVPERTKNGTSLIYEPKWDGFRTLIFVDAQRQVVVQSRNGEDLSYCFPEVVETARGLPTGVGLDGELVIAQGGRLQFELLGQRIRPRSEAGGWKIAELAGEHPAHFVAFDVVCHQGQSVEQQPFEERRRLLEGLPLPDGMFLTPATTDPELARRWFEEFEGAGLDGIVAKPVDLTYQPGKRVMLKVKHIRTADCVVAGWRPYKVPGPDGQPVVGSLLLGLYDEQGQLHHVGVAASFSAAKRLELTETLATHAATDEHPWLAWAQAHGGRIPGVQSRWSAGKDLSFVPTNPDLVAEVKYDHMEGSRFRHVTKLLRLRPDRDPDSCTYEQLETPVRFDLSEVLPGL
ncbi:MAG: ATP-dependent DNA ligase [Actinobacteria bacterium]|nr:ATP-dependent DNA ligase [Actinomycetota bacterium]